MTSDKSLGSSGTEFAYTKMIVTLSRRIGLIGHSGFTMAKVDALASSKTYQVSDVDV